MSLILKFLPLLLPLCRCEQSVLLTSDSPAVLDAPITFYGSLSGASDPESEYRWRWFDTTSPGHYKETETNGTVTSMNYTIVYPSTEYDTGIYEMTLTIFESEFMFWKRVGRVQIKFELTRALNGHLEVTQNGLNTSTPCIVSSIKTSVIDVKFYDPENFLQDAVIHYFWFINTVNYGQTLQGHYEVNFTEPGDYDVEVNVIAYFDNSSRTRDSVSLLYDTSKKGLTLRQDDGPPNDKIKMAVFRKNIISKQPIGNMTVSGDKLLKHGNLLDLNINCSGSAPWLYCWMRKGKGYNITGNEKCDDPSLMKSACEFPILWYFQQSDTYNILVVITNDVSSHIEVIPVTIYDVASQSPVSIVIIPVVSSIIVVIIIITGVATGTHYRNRLAVEVADFDFGQADEELQYKTFWERLRESFGAHFTSSASDSQSEGGSSVSGRRSVQMPGPVGIGYGSIT